MRRSEPAPRRRSGGDANRGVAKLSFRTAVRSGAGSLSRSLPGPGYVRARLCRGLGGAVPGTPALLERARSGAPWAPPRPRFGSVEGLEGGVRDSGASGTGSASTGGSSPRAASVASSISPVSSSLAERWNFLIAPRVRHPMTPSIVPGTYPLSASSRWTASTSGSGSGAAPAAAPRACQENQQQQCRHHIPLQSHRPSPAGREIARRPGAARNGLKCPPVRGRPAPCQGLPAPPRHGDRFRIILAVHAFPTSESAPLPSHQAGNVACRPDEALSWFSTYETVESPKPVVVQGQAGGGACIASRLPAFT